MTESWVVVASPSLFDDVRFDGHGLVPCITQDEETREVLMFAWMDKEALQRTLLEGRVTYFSRSRSEYWRKGDTSGHIQVATRISLDCDGDVLLAEVQQVGPACHTGNRSCFDGGARHD
jgi:phosphoribosyl-AMP cyclohydrolase